MNINNDGLNLSSLENKSQNDEFIKRTEKSRGRATREESEPIEKPLKPDLKDLKELQIPKVQYDDIIYKNKLIRKISQYQKVFHEFLGRLSLERLDNKSIDELEAFLTNIKEIISSRNIDNNITQFVQFLPYGIEEVGKRAGLELDGYGQHINRDKNYYYTMQEILIENNILDNIKVDPKLKLSYILCLGAYQVHKINTLKKSDMNNKLNSTIDPTKYADL